MDNRFEYERFPGDLEKPQRFIIIIIIILPPWL